MIVAVGLGVFLTASLFLPLAMNVVARRGNPPDLPEGGTP